MKKLLSILFVFLTLLLFSQIYFLTDGGIYKSTDKILDGKFKDICFLDNKIYAIYNDSIVDIFTKKEIYIESPIYIGEGYFLSNNRLYKFENGKLELIRIISNLEHPFVYKDIIFGINMGNVVALDNGKIVWSLSPNNGKIHKIRIANGKLAVFSSSDLSIFDIENPKFPKFIKKFNIADDYVYNGYHVILKNNLLQFYDENNKLIFSKNVNGNKIITDGENIIVGNYLITKDFNVTTYPFKIIAFINVSHEINFADNKVKLLWQVNLDQEITSKPVAKDGTLYVAATNGKIFKIEDGKITWNYTLPFIVTGHLTLNNDGLLVTCWDDYVYQFDFNGNLMWKVELDSDLTLGAAFDGQIIYVVSDNGILYEIKDGKILNHYDVGKWPISGPFVSLSGSVYIVDGMGYIWKNNKKDKFVGNVKNLAFSLENPQIPPENSFMLLDILNNRYTFKENNIYKNDNLILSLDENIQDGIVGNKFLYVLSSGNKLYVIDLKNYNIVYNNFFENSKFLVMDNIGNLFIIGKNIYALSTNDMPSDSWYSIYKNNLNSSSVNF
ncbi:hypothetical protein H17ap60334_08915 [Thermosipho africanus H17ap60334]|uniref:Pyrrolo-quinoline quinone repeat domain-containing protein n=1 Tax=Thermosipho africanus (strain TCF52B) TaxID=484019 RepID=B7IF27_THEAB|nr:PQQ-binding-like beta-propeller repeat protein [Thermosipho africanus]ACJ74691.1 hypothetical protein THA_186 [Thermosipho africanus TCF52B]EKF48834.1 hypothetical protein H17ap60334_08915 [Thermosipho africanus H17ap60334]